MIHRNDRGVMPLIAHFTHLAIVPLRSLTVSFRLDITLGLLLVFHLIGSALLILIAKRLQL